VERATCHRRPPVDTLKVDASLLGDEPAIGHALIQLGKSMNLNVIAEAIEDIDQLRVAQHLKLAHGQGVVLR
jgi:EAL domain-containing protein (putative c-di-GMP-specific phosphodiesterase class I)